MKKPVLLLAALFLLCVITAHAQDEIEVIKEMQSGDPDAGKSMLNWGGSLLFAAVAAYILQLIFFGN